MFYVDRSFVASYLGDTEAELPANIDTIIEEAEEIIDHYTMLRGRNQFEGSETKDPELYNGMRNAVASQTGWMMELKDMEMEKLEGINSFSIGSFSVSFKEVGGGIKLLSPRAIRILTRLGLIYRGVRS